MCHDIIFRSVEGKKSLLFSSFSLTNAFLASPVYLSVKIHIYFVPAAEG